jgi:cell division protein ZapA (FtsZ GTPase activity inhibitor)
MELETKEFLGAMSETMNRLNAAAVLLERTAAHLEQREASMAGDVQKIVAAVELGAEVSQRELELERKLAQAEQKIAELSAQESKAVSARKTLPAATTQLLAKQGITSLESIEAGALDAALTGLSLEQRIAVKAQLLRAGALA